MSEEKKLSAVEAYMQTDEYKVRHATAQQRKLREAADTVLKADDLLKAAGIPHIMRVQSVPHDTIQILIPDDHWKYSVVCHPYSYGYPNLLELGWKNKYGAVDVEGWLTPQDALDRIQEMGV